MNPYQAPQSAVAEPAEQTQPVKLFSISGRIGRTHYLAYGGYLCITGTLLSVALAFLFDRLAGPDFVGGAFLIGGLIVLALGFSLTVRRSHDFGARGWLAILLLLPLVNLMFWFIPGNNGPNRYGLPPARAGVLTTVFAYASPVLVSAFMLLFFAAMAPEDLTRPRISELILFSYQWREAVTAYHEANGRLPATAADVPKEMIPADNRHRFGTVELGANGFIVITVSPEIRRAAGKTIFLVPQASGGALRWTCSGTIDPRYLPASCRN